MSEDASFPGKPWQNSEDGSRNKLNTLFNDGLFSDLTIRFQGKDITYKAHKAILAVSSAIFEKMLFGPMATTGSELELQDDNPEAFKILLAHCYELNSMPSDIDEALEVYMLADKYFLEKLGNKCSNYICKHINRDNIEKVLDFSTNFNFEYLEKYCYRYLKDFPEVLFALSHDWFNKILESDGFIGDELVFKNSWRYPNEILQDDTCISILKNKKCEELTKFSGCISANVIHNICWSDVEEGDFKNELNISFTTAQQANEILKLLNKRKFTGFLSFHLQCQVIPPDSLIKLCSLPYPLYERPDLFLSNVDENGIEWAIKTIQSLKPVDESFGTISFPRSKLTFDRFKILLRKMKYIFFNVRFPNIQISTPNIPKSKEIIIEKWLENEINIKNTVEDDDPDIGIAKIYFDLVGW